MSKLISEPIRVFIDKDFKPAAFIWRRRLYRVLDILSSWWEPSDWWEGKPESFMLRVSATRGIPGVYELRKTGTVWFLYRVLD